MPDTEANDIIWDLLDRRAVNDLVARDGADRVLGALMGSALSPEAQAQTLSDLAVEGNVPAQKKEYGNVQVLVQRAWLQTTFKYPDRVRTRA